MPIYEFYCPDNNKIYSFFARSMALCDKVPHCPDNQDFRMIKQASRFAVTGRARESSPDDATPDLDRFDERKIEAAMREMESEMATMTDEQGDPRQLARMMRRLSDATGEKMPAAMQEMLSRMEAGEDPEKLEEQYGELLDQDEQVNDQEPSGDERRSARPRSRSKPAPHRDPTLYEMAEYI